MNAVLSAVLCNCMHIRYICYVQKYEVPEHTLTRNYSGGGGGGNGAVTHDKRFVVRAGKNKKNILPQVM